MAKDFLADRVIVLKGQKQMTESQRLMIWLFEKENRTKEEQAQLDILVKAERSELRARRAKQDASKLLGARKEEERKARNHRLIQLGLLIERSGLAGWDKGELLGGLLSLASIPTDKRCGWKNQGDSLLAQEKNSSSEAM